jgi:hypothetical protein
VTQLRFLIDDTTQCKTQQAVLLAFAADLEERALGKVVRSSLLPELRQWGDVPAESSRRLALRILALQPAPDLLTVFLPGHIVPGRIDSMSQQSAALTACECAVLADLDLFTIDNAHREAQLLHDFVVANPDYESVSSYDGFNTAALPSWLVSGGLISTLQLTQRPWYSAFAPTRIQWLIWVKKAIELGFLDIAMVEEDVHASLVRPSLLSDIKALLDGINAPPMPDLTLDSIFVPPERRLTDIQYRLLHSAELQMRSIKYAKRKTASKLAKQGTRKSLMHLLRPFLKLGYRAAYFVYSVTARPAVVRLRQKSGTPK